MSGDNTRGVELTNLNSTDNHSVLAFLHGIEHPDFSKKPAKPSLVIKIVQILMSLLFLGWLLWSKGVPKKGSTMEDAHFFALASFAAPNKFFCIIIKFTPISWIKSHSP